MAIEKYIVVSGVTGVHKLITARSNGVIVFDTIQQKNRFIPAKTTDVTPLGMISVYTDTEEGAVALKEVFQRIHALDQPVERADAQSELLRTYFRAILPEHDEERVRIADIKKILKWYHFLVAHNLIEDVLKEEAPKEEAPKDDEITG